MQLAIHATPGFHTRRFSAFVDARVMSPSSGFTLALPDNYWSDFTALPGPASNENDPFILEPVDPTPHRVPRLQEP